MKRGPRSKNMGIGSVFGRLTVLELVADKKSPKARCRCVCGKETISSRSQLMSGRALSCGCLSGEATRARNTTHGQSKSQEYLIFMGMLNRCNNPTKGEYELYGGRGIKVEYANFEEFIADVGPRPAGAYIDREDNDGNYKPGNCRWVTPAVSIKNRRVSKIWTVDGVEYESCKLAAAAAGVHPSTIAKRCNEGAGGWSSRLKYPPAGEAQ